MTTAIKTRGLKTTKTTPTRVAKKPATVLPGPADRTTAENEIARAQAKMYRTALNRDAFLRSQGPAVVEVELPQAGARAVMRRVDLMELVKRKGEFWPMRNAILSMIHKGGFTDDMIQGEGLYATLELAAAIALSCIVIPSEEYIEASEREYVTEQEARRAREAALANMKARDLRPLFVSEGEEPDDDQAILRWFVPDEAENAAGESLDSLTSIGDDEDAGYIHWQDLIVIMRTAHRYGPGVLGRRFRGGASEGDPLEALLDLARS